jgi:DNA-binding transcriptional ArsR family regulator
MLETLTALAEPNRLRIVELLRDGPAPVGTISQRLQLRQPQVSKHLHLLKSAGLVAVRPVAQLRLYSLQPARFREMDAWLDRYRSLLSERFTQLDDVLAELTHEKEDHPNDASQDHTKAQERGNHARSRKPR